MVVQQAEIEQLLSLDHEQRHLEVKGPGRLNDRTLVGRVARATMAMGNLRDGGLVCIGIDDDKIAAMQPGLSATQLVDWSDFDNVSSAPSVRSDAPAEPRSSGHGHGLDLDQEVGGPGPAR